ncbi:hypothetical protein ACFJIV_11725 [Mucilaginibacter sp. UC70_90]
MKLNFEFDTQYNQFYLSDSLCPREMGRTDFWTPEAYDGRLAIAEGILGIGTECYGPVKGELEVLDSVNENFDIAKFDHIVEGGIKVESGKIEILDCPTSTIQLEVKVDPGEYRVRIYSSNLESVEGGEEGDDYYRIELWPDNNITRKVLKQYWSK